MAKPPNRQVYHSVLKRDGWRVVQNGKAVSAHDTQKEAEAEAINLGRQAYDQGGLGEAVLHKSNGEIREERTYGKAPERTQDNFERAFRVLLVELTSAQQAECK